MAAKQWEFWIDRGGTFTDIVAQTPDGTILTHKLLSENPERYRDAAVQGIKELMGTDTPQAGSIRAVKMGTTVATNALLERKGEPVLLLITKGFKDLLTIGYQNRPRLFDLEIIRPERLYLDVAEVTERLDADGQTVTPLDEETARAVLQAAFDKGLRAVAIAYLHAYLNPEHEDCVAALAADIGFTQISTSHGVSKLAKLVGRGDTTVVDAYLSPILRRYVDQVADALDVGHVCERLLFMQSNGGLTDARMFQGKDAVLSGPAGGIVGMVKTGEQAGFDRLIGFDMGGTSTDVSHYAGTYERSFETEVAGVRMRAPMMDIHTVAAGGGSICMFRDGRLQVGPESAGADPGPACYRRGGPLTVTDCNVYLGYLAPEHFPTVFGSDGNQPLDRNAVAERFAEMAQLVADETGEAARDPADLAIGFLRIAVDNMANAIKKISVQRGHDVTGYTLQCFGGAGGQHACDVAYALGMKRVIVHPYAGVLSAYGMGLAEVRALRETQLDVPLADVDRAKTAISELGDAARAEVSAQGISDIRVLARAHLRYDGSHQPLEVAFGSASEMQAAFEDAHQQRFGFTSPERAILFEMVSVEAIGGTPEYALPAVSQAQDPQPFSMGRRIGDGGAVTTLEFYRREDIGVGQRIEGMAVIIEATGTTVVKPGWRASTDRYGNLILDQVRDAARPAAEGTTADPVVLEVMSNLFMSVADQMGATLANTSWSVNIKERLDFSCAIFDAAGDLVANAPHVPVHLGSMSESIKTVMRLNPDVAEGDAYMLNSPYNGGTHLPDVTVVTPVFVDGKPAFWLGSRGHHADIGGRTPGSGPPDSTHIDQEGVLIDNVQLVKAGRLREAEARAVLASGRYPCRNIDQNMADLKAQVAANETGRQALLKVCDAYGADVVTAYMGHVQDNAAASVARALTGLRNGSFRYDMDNGAIINVAVTVNGDTATVDFTGTSSQQAGNYNAPLAVCRAVVLYVFRTLVGSDIPLNEGCLRPITIIVPEGSFLNPTYPAAVIAGNTEVSQAACNALYGALGRMACSQATMNNFIWGNADFQNYETIAGGTGAGPGFAGCDAVQTHMTNTRMTDPEILEKRFPVRLEEFGIRRGSGGAGKWNGGNGAVRRMRFLKPVTVTTLCSRRSVAPFGGAGGAPGAKGVDRVIFPDGREETLPGNAEVALPEGGVFVMETPGGGGWGTPEDV
ncbi:5-oxoprolinase (ATP-hydrolysing) [Cognatiyoonia koreensis]|uniref:5-oxoprolinase (ATP-hydrolysing) n=1 Tax=Cognatiyoonia koreensis TaxID=364200 RepID=A0A1I0RAX4_9RHOB|nr:hydantoinase B/oxoprolinase family protein [Cognatiyoonia koreensis]SEW37982.1 5-oxoprolinase (ATP-hydrolysing) [Cognatiyoonia koreensis]